MLSRYGGIAQAVKKIERCNMSKKQKGFVEYVKAQYAKRGIIIDRVKVFGRTICLYAAGEIVYSIERRA